MGLRLVKLRCSHSLQPQMRRGVACGSLAKFCLALVCGYLTMIRSCTLSLIVLVSLGCSETPAPEAAEKGPDPDRIVRESARMNAWFDNKYEELLDFSPMTKTFLGRKAGNSDIDDFSVAAEQRELGWRRETVLEMERDFDYQYLDPETRASYDLWKYQYEEEAAGARFRQNEYIFEQMSAIQSFLPNFLISFHEVETPEDMEAYLHRIEGVSIAIEQLIERARANAEAGVRPPKFAYDGVLKQARAQIDGVPFTESGAAPLWNDANQEIDTLLEAGAISEIDADRLRDTARLHLLQSLQPAYMSLIAWVEEDLPNAVEVATGVGGQPNGKAYYEYQLRQSTTTDIAADAVHALGLAEVARIHADMRQIMAEVEFDGTLAEFFEFIREDEKFYFPNTDEGRANYIAAAEASLDFINERLPEYFGVLPKADLVVKRVEPYREQAGAAQHYYPGTPDGSRSGIYYAHLSDMTSMPINQLEVFAYHEGNPGHHMQISIAQELAGVPMFRTQTAFTAYVEGWALYSELLALEMGAYEDPYSNFGRLTTELWRAIRLVVDSGLHAKGWTEQQAIDYFTTNSPVPLESVTSEVRRYIVTPGQATAYKIGMIRIQELRARAEAELGDKFDIRAFHDTVLGGGALPMSFLERRINDWIAENKT